MPPTLAVTDNGDGTAAATVAGSGGGAVAVWVQPVTGSALSGPWAPGGTRAGDGPLTLTLAAGLYAGYCEAGAGLSGVVFFGVTTATLSVPDRVFAAVKAWAQLLALPCTARVYDYADAADPNVQYPCLLLTSDDARQTAEGVLNGRDDWGHPVRLLVRDVAAQFDAAAKARFRAWRQALTRAFHNQRLAGVAESVRNVVEPGALLRRVPGDKNRAVAESELTVRCVTREVRGLGA